jgi:hypothetical protein
MKETPAVGSNEGSNERIWTVDPALYKADNRPLEGCWGKVLLDSSALQGGGGAESRLGC